MVQLSGLTVRDEDCPAGDIEIRVTGLRPGEKLYEELLIGDNPEPTAHERIMKAREDYVHWDRLVSVLSTMRHAAEQNDEAMIRSMFCEYVHGFGRQQTLVSDAAEA